jgi:hypothetical protein
VVYDYLCNKFDEQKVDNNYSALNAFGVFVLGIVIHFKTFLNIVRGKKMKKLTLELAR